MPPPVTPTAGRDHLHFAERVLVTPVNEKGSGLDIDTADYLLSAFESAECIGEGNHSKVYRVTVPKRVTSFLTTASSCPDTPAKRSPGNRGAPGVYAVKVSTKQFTGLKDREKQLKECRILSSLAHAEHVVRYVDSWEFASRLYIQTEFCEGGSLEAFLWNIGHKGRLDDFRIWKILHDLSLVSLHALCTHTEATANSDIGCPGDP